MLKTSPRWRALAAAAAAALFVAGCAQSNGDINRVQPNVVEKTDLLDGVWYFRNSVTWTPATTGFTFPGETGNIEKIVFEIQQNHLVGYRAYPYVLGAEIEIDPTSKAAGTTVRYCDKAGVCAGGQPYYGSPVVAFPIESHFDIQRNYNPTTGEVGNVVSENASDRVWNQREFIRVDWSANVLNPNSGFNWNTLQNPAGGSSSGSWIQPNEKGEDPTDWPNREYDENKRLKYMDYTGRYLANPDIFYSEYYEQYLPYCFFRGYEQYDCSSSEIRMRISMSRVDPKVNRDYEPLQFDNDVMSKFGYFRTERTNYDRRFGYNNSAVVRLGNRHRIWKSSFEKDSAGEPNPEKPIAMDKRTPKPITYYFTRADVMGGQANYDEYMIPGKKLEANWDKAFRRAIAAAQGKDPQQVPQMLHVCDNPVKAGAPEACGPEGFSPRFGDLRYNFLNSIAEPVANGLLGYGPSSADPETGEIISANANTYLGAVDVYGRYVLDLVDLLSGEKNLTDYITGADMREYLKNNPSYSFNQTNQNGARLLAENQSPLISTEQTKGAFERPSARSLALLQGLKGSGGLPKYTRDANKVAADILANNPQLESAILDNPEFGDEVIGLLPADVRGRAQVDPEFRRKASRNVLTNLKAGYAAHKQRVEWASRRNITLLEFYDRTMVSLANREAARRAERIADLVKSGAPKGCANPTACTPAEARLIANDEISSRVRQAVWQATSEHEIGHTFGLRHNFQGSFDAVNYFDKYWELRRPTLTVSQSGVNKIPRTPPDLKTAAAGDVVLIGTGGTPSKEVQYDYEYSSIMDYSGKINGDWAGIGKYDEAAILFAYSGDTQPGYVEVFESARRDKKDFPGSDGKVMTITGAQLDLPLINAQHKSPANANYTERYHYSVMPLHFGEGADLDAVYDDGLKKLQRRSLRKYSEVKAKHQQVAELLEANPNIVKDPDLAAAQLATINAPLEVPYMFCSDDHVGGILSCNRNDRGPDYYEMARQEMEDYYNYYFSSHFRRDRYNFSSNNAFFGTYGTFLAVADIYKKWVFEFYGKGSLAQQLFEPRLLDPMIQDYWTMAVLDGINTHLNVLSVPPAGMFMYRNLPQGAQWDIVSEGDEYDALNATGRAKLEDYYKRQYKALDFADLSRGLGRRMYSRYDYKSGFGFFNRIQEVGHYNDQTGAMFAAVDPSAEFLGADNVADRRRYNIPYYMVFKPELTATFSALWGSQEELVRPLMYFKKNVLGDVTREATLDWRRFVNGADLITGFEYPAKRGVLCAAGQTQNCISPDQNPGQANIQLTWTARIYSLYLGEALFSVNYDLDYAKANQIFKLGGSEQQSVAPGFHALEVQDITTGSRYVALEKDGALPNSTPAIRIINIARDELAMVKNPATCPLPAYLAYVGYSCMRAEDANNPAQVELSRTYWMEVLRGDIRDLDLMRGMYQAYGKAF